MCGFVVSVKNKQNIAGFYGVGKDTLARGPDGLRVWDIQAGGLNIHIEFSHLFINL